MRGIKTNTPKDYTPKKIHSPSKPRARIILYFALFPGLSTLESSNYS